MRGARCRIPLSNQRSVASGFSRKAVAVDNLLLASGILPAEAGSHVGAIPTVALATHLIAHARPALRASDPSQPPRFCDRRGPDARHRHRGEHRHLHGVLPRPAPPLPYREPERLVFVWNAWKNGNHTEVAIPDYLDRRSEAPAIEDAALIAPGTATLSLSGPPEQVGAARVTASLFTTLGRGALIGRVFADRDEHAVVLTHALWQSRFGADLAAVGRTVRVNAEPHVILGVLPADFELPIREAELLLPFVFTPQQMSDQERGNEFSLMIARLRGGATIAELEAQMQTIVARLIDRVARRGPTICAAPGSAPRPRHCGTSSSATPAARCSCCRPASRSSC